MIHPRLLAVALPLVATPWPALAAQAAAAFAAGRWEAVTSAARAERTADALALSARALLVRAAYQARRRQEVLALLAEAERDAAASLALAPGNREGLLQRAAAIGYRAKFERSREKAVAGRDQLRAITRQFPEWDAGWVALALWHGESVGSVGKLLARTALGASFEAMERDFARAAQLDAVSPVIPASHGLLLVRIGAGAPGEAQRLLEDAQRRPARDAYEALLQQHAAQVLSAMASGGARAARERARALAPFASLEA